MALALQQCVPGSPVDTWGAEGIGIAYIYTLRVLQFVSFLSSMVGKRRCVVKTLIGRPDF